MKLIIDIPEMYYEFCRECVINRTDTVDQHFIAIGTPYEERSKGKWIKQENKKTEFFCSECGRMIDTKPFTRTDKFPFCHCGADMREADNEL